MSDFDNIINDRLNEDDGENFPRREMNWDKLSQRLDIFEAANPQNDFDNIINDRLNADDGEFFPRREMNWDKLSQRLDDFEVANPLPKVVDLPKPGLTTAWKRWAWTSAAAALMGVSGLLWHLSEVKSLEQRNAELAQQIAAYKAAPNKAGTVFGKAKGDNSDTAAATTETPVGQTPNSPNSLNKEAQSAEIVTNNGEKTPSVSKKEIAGGSGLEQKQANTPQNMQKAAVVDIKSAKGNDKTTDSKNTAVQKRTSSQIAEMGNKKVQDAVPFDKKNVPLNGQKIQLNQSIAQQTPPSVLSDNLEASKANGIQNKPNEVTVAPKEGDKTVKLAQKDIDKIETVAQQTPPSSTPTNIGDVPKVTEPVSDKKNETEPIKTVVADAGKPKIDSVAKTSVAVQNEDKKDENIIPTENNKKGLKRLKAILPIGFAIGVEHFRGSEMPDVQGIMPTTGNGFSAELMFAKNISLVASGDLLETHFDVGERPRRFHVKDEPMPPKPNVELHHIRGEQHSRLLSLNAKYVFGQKWWAQPNITVGHSWHKIAGYPVNYVFKDITTGDETPVAVQVETEKIRNLWQAGVGVEKKIKRWTFGVSAEMQKDFSNPTDPSGKSVASNFGILRGGVKFNIF